MWQRLLLIDSLYSSLCIGNQCDLYCDAWSFWCNPDDMEQTEEKSMIILQYFLSFFLDQLVQLWRWICGTSTDPGAGRKCASLAQHDGIYGSDHHFPDDSGTDCDQCSNLCWDETDRNAGSGCGYTWIYHTILHYRDDHCKIVLKIPGNGHAAGNTWRDQTGGGCTDRIGGNFHFADSILGSFRENGDI